MSGGGVSEAVGKAQMSPRSGAKNPDQMAKQLMIKGEMQAKLEIETPGIRKKITLSNFDEIE